MKTRKKTPIIGESFNPEMMNMGEVFANVADEIDYYRPKGFLSIWANLIHASCAYIDSDDPSGADADSLGITMQIGHDALNDAENILTEWAREKTRNDYIYYRCSGDFAGFAYDVESAIEDADWHESDTRNGATNPHKPGDGAGLEVYINDHGNVTAWLYGRNGHKRELFSVV